jgi:hypothetical protein
MKKPTENQIRVIGYIEQNLNLKFQGATITDAQEFISIHIEESKAARKGSSNLHNSQSRIVLADDESDWIPGYSSSGCNLYDSAMDEIATDRIEMDRAFSSYEFSD